MFLRYFSVLVIVFSYIEGLIFFVNNFTLLNIRKFHILLEVEYLFGYNKKSSHDCLIYQDLHEMRSNGQYDDNCEEWCNPKDGCGGFTVYRGTCYFKGTACRVLLEHNPGADLFLKFGNYLNYFEQILWYRSGTVNSKTVNSKFHLIRSYCEIFFYHLPNISCLKCAVNSNFYLIQRKILPTNDFELTIPNL